MSKKVTITSLALAAGVSPATVSIVLNHRPLSARIPCETRARILSLAEELHYRPSHLAQSMARQRTGLIGFVCGGIEEPYFGALSSALSHECESLGYHLITLLTAWDYEHELNALDLIYSKMVDGIVITSDVFSTANPRLLPFRQSDMPLVVCSERVTGDCNSVAPDYASGMDALFGELSARGVRDVLVLELRDYHRKGDAAVASGAHHGVSVRRCDFSPDEHGVSDLAGRLRCSLPEVLVCPSDWLCMSLVSRLYELGVRVPEDLSVISIDGTVMCRQYAPTLANIRIDFQGTAQTMMDIIQRKLHGESEFMQRFVPTSFEDGGSLRRR